jgi:hypothetical protein
MPDLRHVDVFTPADFPSYTYIARDNQRLETALRDALATPGEVISISGPSKSGKTVLVERVVGQDNLITITGAGIHSPEHLWDRVLDWMDVPDSSTTASTRQAAEDESVSASVEVGVPSVARLTAGAKVGGVGSRSTTDATASERRGLPQVVDEIADSDFVLLIDDFHYMDREIQVEVARQIKEAARLHIKICTASVPHRADDVVRSNPELRGRVRAIDIEYWAPPQLQEIAHAGFPLLNVKLDPEAVQRFALEASGSPQLMQAICLQACFQLGVRDKLPELSDISLQAGHVADILQETSTRTDYSSLVKTMHTGPKTRGTERKEFEFADGTIGDVYRCVLLALASDPPSLTFTYNELTERVRTVCTADTPQPASLYQSCSQISKMAIGMYPTQRVIEWDEDFTLLDIIDPYFLFYLRWSRRLDSLAERADA